MAIPAFQGEEIVAEPAAIRYRAFLSYSHRDIAWGRWLHRSLESYRIDKDLVGRETPAGPVPRTLRPIFRDREDFSGGHTLTDATVAALDASAALLVLCSPVAATRPAVNEEVRLFRSRHPDRPVIPVIIDGSAPENFPPALRYELAADGTITDREITVLGPDLRESGDGKSLGLAKVIAGLIGIGTDDVFRRAERARRRRNRFWAALAGVFVLLAFVASGSAVYAWQQLKTNEAFLDATLMRATEIVNEAVAQAKRYNVPRTATLALLGKAEGLFDDMARYGRATPQLRYRKAWMLIHFARNYAILGDTGKRFARANEASRLLSGLAADKPDDANYQLGLSVALDEVGDVLMALGNLPEALKAFRDGRAIAERLVSADPASADRWRDVWLAFINIGNVLMAQGNLPEALQSFRDGLAIAQQVANADPSNAGWQRDLSAVDARIGDVLREQGNLAAALQSFRDGLAIAERLAKADPSNAGWQRDLSVSYEKIGNVLSEQGDLPAALQSFRASLAIRERLAKVDPSNAGWQRDLSVSYETVGDVLTARRDFAAALQSFRDSLAIAERLAKADPSNASWQRDLSVSYEKVGDVLSQQRDFAAALQSFRDSLAIRERLAKADPSNTGWQRDLSVSYSKIGDALADQGNLTEAIKSYRECLAIGERLAKVDPDNAGWQRDLAAGNERLGEVYVARKETDEAKAAFQRALAIYMQLLTRSPDNALVLASATVPLMRLGELYGADGRRYLEAALTILKGLDESGRLEARRKSSIAWIDARLAKLREAQDSPK
jgi:tetratricopeptide (TPR) repeat protein